MFGGPQPQRVVHGSGILAKEAHRLGLPRLGEAPLKPNDDLLREPGGNGTMNPYRLATVPATKVRWFGSGWRATSSRGTRTLSGQN